MKPINVSIGGRTPWRDRKDPYDYSAFTDDATRGFIVYALTNPPAYWNFNEEAQKMYIKVYGANGEARIAQGQCCENTSPVWVVGTLVTQAGQSELEEALKLKAAGKIFGYDYVGSGEIEDHTGMIQINTPFGTNWVDPGNITAGSVKLQLFMDNIRLVVGEVVEQKLIQILASGS